MKAEIKIPEEVRSQSCIKCGKPSVGWKREVVRIDYPYFNPQPYQQFKPGLISFYCEDHIK